jgi:hypothetical protein
VGAYLRSVEKWSASSASGSKASSRASFSAWDTETVFPGDDRLDGHKAVGVRRLEATGAKPIWA